MAFVNLSSVGDLVKDGAHENPATSVKLGDQPQAASMRTEARVSCPVFRGTWGEDVKSVL